MYMKKVIDVKKRSIHVKKKDLTREMKSKKVIQVSIGHTREKDHK